MPASLASSASRTDASWLIAYVHEGSRLPTGSLQMAARWTMASSPFRAGSWTSRTSMGIEGISTLPPKPHPPNRKLSSPTTSSPAAASTGDITVPMQPSCPVSRILTFRSSRCSGCLVPRPIPPDPREIQTEVVVGTRDDELRQVVGLEDLAEHRGDTPGPGFRRRRPGGGPEVPTSDLCLREVATPGPVGIVLAGDRVGPRIGDIEIREAARIELLLDPGERSEEGQLGQHDLA